MAAERILSVSEVATDAGVNILQLMKRVQQQQRSPPPIFEALTYKLIVR